METNGGGATGICRCLAIRHHAAGIGSANSRPMCPSQCRDHGRATAVTNTSPPWRRKFGHQHSSAWTLVQACKHHPSYSTTAQDTGSAATFCEQVKHDLGLAEEALHLLVVAAPPDLARSPVLNSMDRVTIELASCGIGPARNVNVPLDLWFLWVDPDFLHAGARVPP